MLEAEKASEGIITTTQEEELREARRVCLQIIKVGLEAHPDLARRLKGNKGEIAKMRKAVWQTNLPELYRRISAISKQNPALFARALEQCGYKTRVDGQGKVAITATPAVETPLGRLITPEEFEKI